MNKEGSQTKTSIRDLMILDDTQVLGEGAYSKVYRIQLKSDPKKYFAMKTIDINTISKQNAIFLLKEMQLHKRIKHQHIIQYQGSFQEDSKLYYILDYAENSSLFYYIDLKEGLPEDLALRFIYQVGQAIQYLHERQIAHRDIKPENILFDDKFDVKLCDFGWSCLLSKGKERNTICGTYEYMSPEIAYEFTHDYKVDIWSMGILLYEMLHGLPPFKAKTIEEIKQELLDQNIVLNANLSQEVIDLVKMLLRVDASQRPCIDEVLNLPIFQKNIQNFQKDLTTEQLILLATNYMFNSNMGKDKILPKVVEEYYFNTETLNSSIQYVSEISDVNISRLRSRAQTSVNKINKRPIQKLSTTKQEDESLEDMKLESISPTTNVANQTNSSSVSRSDSKEEKKSNDTEKIILGSKLNEKDQKIKKFNFEFSKQKKDFKKYKFQNILPNNTTQEHHFMHYKSQLKPKIQRVEPISLSNLQNKDTLPRLLRHNNKYLHANTDRQLHQRNNSTYSSFNVGHQQIPQKQFQTYTDNSTYNEQRSLTKNNNYSTGALFQSDLQKSQQQHIVPRRTVYARNSPIDTPQNNRLQRVNNTTSVEQRGINKHSSLGNLLHRPYNHHQRNISTEFRVPQKIIPLTQIGTRQMLNKITHIQYKSRGINQALK